LPTTSTQNSPIHLIQSGQGPNLVLLHGFPLDLRIWENQSKSLSDRFRVITPDLPGFGKSGGAGPFTMASLADDVHSLLQSINALPCILGGLSMGGYIAQAFAAKYAADLRGLLLVDTRSNADTPQGRAARDAMVKLAGEKGAAGVADQMLPKLLPPTAPPALVKEIREMIEACPVQTIQYACAALRDRSDHTETLTSLSIPGLILVGSEDVLAPVSMVQEMHGAFAGSVLKIIPGYGHLTPVECPEIVNSAIRDFFRYA
jgi:pimeloyl-ACP methyl ester carboxylesterase